MVKSCAVVGCRTNQRKQNGKVITILNPDVVFRFPHEEKKAFIYQKWVRFVNRENFVVTDNSGICASHFEKKFIKDGKRKTLKWELDPEPTIYNVPILPSLIPTPETKRKKPKDRSLPDEIHSFRDNDNIKSISEIDSSKPSGFTFEKHDTAAIFYKLERSTPNQIPEVTATIIIDDSLHVKLFKKSSPIPLPEWFRKGGDCKCKLVSILENFPYYISNYDESSNKTDTVPQDILEELQNIKYKKPVGQPKYSPDMLCYFFLHLHSHIEFSRNSYHFHLRVC